MALDEPRETDEQLEVDGLKYVIDKDLIAASQPIIVDFTPVGFMVTGNLDTGRDINRCGTCG